MPFKRHRVTLSRRSSVLTVLVAVLVGGVIASPLALVGPPRDASAGAAVKPNIVFILTDDMRLDDLKYMDYTRRLFRRTGTDFTQAISPHPLCCPARAELVTGQYAQNNGVSANKGGDWGGYPALNHKDQLVFKWFQSAGYRTSYVGKFLNKYEDAPDKEVPGLVENNMAVNRIYRPHGLVTYNNGDPQRHRAHQTYYTTRSVIGSISKATRRDRPFFAWAGYVAPHAMPGARRFAPVPPAQYDTLHKGDGRAPSVSQDNFNVARPDGGRRIKPTTVTRIHRKRVLSLYAVDDGVRKIVRTLKKKGVYDNTVLVFASDNGFGLGAHRVVTKNQPYQDVVRVPLMLAGPGIPAGVRDRSVATLVDLPATLAKLAQVDTPYAQDGRSLFGLPDDRAVLIQAGTHDDRFSWRGVYTGHLTYLRRATTGTVEFYDREQDPQELDNRTTDPRIADMELLMEQLGSCAGASCQATYPTSP